MEIFKQLSPVVGTRWRSRCVPRYPSRLRRICAVLRKLPRRRSGLPRRSASSEPLQLEWFRTLA